MLIKLLSTDANNKQSRLVTVTGPPGIGKTALACATSHFIHERGLFDGGCIYVNAEDIKKMDQFLK